MKNKQNILSLLNEELGKVIIGQERLITEIIICLFSKGHLLLKGLPGLAKTTMVKAISEVFDADFSRVQFTPDLMPSDLIGYEILEEQKGKREMKFIKGPIFTNILLADEVNRTPPKTQSALLQAMQEGQVTVMGRLYQLDDPFLVMATQNPIDQEGTYPLPEAQLDRFMFLLNVEYPDFKDEVLISQLDDRVGLTKLKKIIKLKEMSQHVSQIQKIKIAEKVVEWIVRLVHSTRPSSIDSPKIIKDNVEYGASPRASKFIIQAAKAFAYLEDCAQVEKHHIERVSYPILRHRIHLNFSGRAEGISPDDLIKSLLKQKI